MKEPHNCDFRLDWQKSVPTFLIFIHLLMYPPALCILTLDISRETPSLTSEQLHELQTTLMKLFFAETETQVKNTLSKGTPGFLHWDGVFFGNGVVSVI